MSLQLHRGNMVLRLVPRRKLIRESGLSLAKFSMLWVATYQYVVAQKFCCYCALIQAFVTEVGKNTELIFPDARNS
jgi:hypothetical protein